MLYPGGVCVNLGDKVKLWNGYQGTVVCSIDTNEYTPSFTKAEWGYLETGIVIEADNGGLFHYAQADEDFEKIESIDAKAA
jgi:hypothetical protein